MPCICCVYILHILTISFVRDMTRPQVSMLWSWSSNISACLDRLPIRRGRIFLLSTCTDRSSHPLLQFLPHNLAEWIANNYAAELNVPPRPDPSRPWSTTTLNRILQTSCLTRAVSTFTVSRVRVRSVSRGYARPVLPIQHGTPSILGKICQG